MSLTRRSRARAIALVLATIGLVASVPLLQAHGDAAPIALEHACSMDPTGVAEFGNTAVSGPTLATLQAETLPLTLPADLAMSATVDPGGAIHTDGSVHVDVQAIADDLLENRVKPQIRAAQPGLETTAYVDLRVRNLRVHLPVPDQTSVTGSPTVTSTGPAAALAVDGGDLVLSVGDIAAGAYQRDGIQGGTTSTTLPALEPFTIDLDVDSVAAAGVAPGTVIELHPGTITFDLTLEAGVYFFGSLISGGVTAPESCTPNFPADVLASTVVNGGEPTSSTTPTTRRPTTTRPPSTTAPADRPGSITGFVQELADGAPLAGIVVTIMEANPSWVVAATATTDQDGRYHVEGLAPAYYSIRFFDPTGAHERTWKGYYTPFRTYRTAEPIFVPVNVDVRADQRLAPAPTGKIVGRAQTTVPDGIPGIHVALYTQNDGFWGATTTGALGYFQFNGVPAGNYFIQYTDPSGTYRSQWYNFKLLFWNANIVTVGDGTTRADALMG